MRGTTSRKIENPDNVTVDEAAFLAVSFFCSNFAAEIKNTNHYDQETDY